MTKTDRHDSQSEANLLGGFLFLLKLVVEFSVVIGMAMLGAFGDAGNAAPTNAGWMVGCLLGILAVFCVDRLTIGL